MNHIIAFSLLSCLWFSIRSHALPRPYTEPHSANNASSKTYVDAFGQILKVNNGNNYTMTHNDILQSWSRREICKPCPWRKSEDGTVPVPYVLDLSYIEAYQNLIVNSMQEFESLTCVRFVKRTNEVDYLDITSSDGCLSYVGRIGGHQVLRLEAPGCMFRGIIQHEINHALGFQHENTRADSDNYVTVNYKNVIPGSEIAFSKTDDMDLSLPYDYNSVMHFPRNAFSIDPARLDTITPTPDPTVPIGQRYGISVLDVTKINHFYKCNVCSTLLNTPSGDFASPNYPSNYKDNMNCVWLIRILQGQVSLTFKHFDIQDSEGCASDYIRIYDGPSVTSPMLLDKTCGTKQIPKIVGSNDQMLIEFVSDSVTTSAGFSASYNTFYCGGSFFADNGNFTSLGFESGSYLPNMKCDYNIHAPENYKILLNGYYDIEETTFCYHDELIVYASGVVGPPSYVYCGKGSFSITSTDNAMLLRFKSDEYIQNAGFNVTYSFFQ